MRTIAKSIFLGLAVASAAVAGCSGHTDGATQASGSDSTDSHDIQLSLTTGGATINTVHYDITGPTTVSGNTDVSHSTKESAVIGGLKAGTGYAISLSATSTDAGLGITCKTASPVSFTVLAQLTPVEVDVAIVCTTPVTTGSIYVNSTLNICPVVTSFGTAVGQPAEVLAGNTIGLAVASTDADSDGSTTTYSWTVNNTAIAEFKGADGGADTATATGTSPTLDCLLAGPGGDVTVAVAIGQSNDPACVQTASFTLHCTSVARCGDGIVNGGEVCACLSDDDACIAAHAAAGTTAKECVSDGADGGSNYCDRFPKCGDGTCAATETCDSCAKDCGDCTVNMIATTLGQACADGVKKGCLASTLTGSDQTSAQTCANAATSVITTGAWAGKTRRQACLDTMSCLLGSKASASDGLACFAEAAGALACFCGTAQGATCLASPNGVCLSAEEAGLESTDPSAIAGGGLFGDTTGVAGAAFANSVASCMGDSTNADTAPCRK